MKLIYQIKLIFGLVILSVALYGQGTITGTVIDDIGDAVIGGTVQILGTTTGAATDIDGKYSIKVPAGTHTVQASYTGYETKQQTVTVADGETVTVDFTMGVDEAVLDEVVVIGYGTVKKEDATGAIQSVNEEDFNKGAISSPQELLVGKVAGVNITTNDGAPGNGSTIRIRGGSSLSASNDPLIVIDGVPIDNGGGAGSRNPLNLINPNDIETFTVLKDASATAIYGSRASNGVILITTKKGALGKKIQVGYSGNFSVSNRIGEVDVLSANEFRTLINENADRFPSAPELLGDANTNWQDVIYQTAIGTDHNLNLSGGIADVLPYRLSLGYTDKQGVLKTDKFQRQTAALNLSPGFLDNTLQIKTGIKYMRTKNRFADNGAIGAALAMDPTQPVTQNNAYGNYFTWLDVSGNPNTLAPKNPLALLEMTDNQATVNRYVLNGTVDYRFSFLPELRANLNVAYDRSHGDGRKNIPANAPFAFNVDSTRVGGAMDTYEETKTNSLLEYYMNYEKQISDNFKFDILGGYSWQKFSFDKTDINSTIDEVDRFVFENSGELYLLSLYGRTNLSFFDKYLLTFTLRRDASSRFSEDNRWGTFPSLAFAWKILSNGTGPLNNLKLRLGYGVTGQQDVGGFYEYQPRYLESTPTATYQFGDEFVRTLRAEGYDAAKKWEETTTYNAGLDFGFLKDRIYGSFEVYYRKTEDLLNFVSLPAGTNLTNFLNINVGDLENTGFEFSLNTTPVQKKDLTWDVGFNLTYNRNEITKLTASDDPNYIGVQVGGITGAIGNTVQIHTVGYAANTFFLYEQVYDESGAPIEGLFVDVNQDGVISSEDLVRAGNPAPEIFMGFNTSVGYKNFTLSASGRANIGNEVYNNIQSDNAFISKIYHPTNYLVNVHSDVNNINFENPSYLSDHFLYNGSFFRLDFVTLSYDFMEPFKGMSRLGVSATLQNPFIITNYSGVDPEINGGIDNNIYPRVRTFVFGVNATF